MEAHQTTLIDKVKMVLVSSNIIAIEALLGAATLLFGMLMPSGIEHSLTDAFSDFTLIVIRSLFLLCGTGILLSCTFKKIHSSQLYIVLLIVQAFLWHLALLKTISYNTADMRVNFNYVDIVIFGVVCVVATYIEIRRLIYPK